MALALADAAVSATGVLVENRSVDGVAAAVGVLDKQAWDLQEAVERGDRRPDEYEDAFRRARAANALLFAFDTPSLVTTVETAYEAFHAVQDEASLLAAARAATGTRN